jgi:vitamin B12 transporter
MRFWKDRKKTDGGEGRPRLLAAALAAAALALPAGYAGSAEIAAADNAVSRLDPVEVTATRVERKVSEQAASVTVIGREEMEAKLPFVAGDVLKSLPGVSVQRSGSPGNLENIRIRGAYGNHTLVLVDGFPVNAPTSGEFDVSSLPVDGFERIEVVRGPQSALYGSNAIGGVVNFLPRTGAEGAEGGGGLAVGSHDTLRWNGYGQGGGKGGSLFGGVSGFESGGDLENDGTSLKSILLSGKSGRTGGGAFHGIVLATDEHKETPVTDRGFDPVADRTRRDFLAGARWEAPLPERFTLALSGSFFNEYLNNDEPPTAALADWYASTIRSDKSVLRADGRARIVDGLDLLAGAEYQRDRARDEQAGESFGFPWGSSLSRTTLDRSAYAQVEGRTPGNRFGGSLGIRADRYTDTPTHWTPRASLFVTALPGVLRFRTAYGQGFRLPTVNEKYSPLYGNPSLSPESSWSWEAGSDLTLAGGRVRLSGTWFYQTFRDLITFSGMSLANVNRAVSKGIEAELAFVARKAEGTLFYTLTDTERENTGTRILRIPRHRGGVTAALLPVEGARIQAEWTAESDQLDLAPYEYVDARRPGFGRLDLFARYGFVPAASPFREVALTGKVENLLNREYEERRGYPAPGISFLAGVEAKI